MQTKNTQSLRIQCGTYLYQIQTHWGGGVQVGVYHNKQTLGIQCSTYLDQI